MYLQPGAWLLKKSAYYVDVLPQPQILDPQKLLLLVLFQAQARFQSFFSSANLVLKQVDLSKSQNYRFFSLLISSTTLLKTPWPTNFVVGFLLLVRTRATRRKSSKHFPLSLLLLLLISVLRFWIFQGREQPVSDCRGRFNSGSMLCVLDLAY